MVLLGAIHFTATTSEAKARDVRKQVESMLSKDDTTHLVDSAIPLIYRHFGDQRLTELLRAVWNADMDRYPGLAWSSLADEEVRLKFATLWAQWVRETQIDKREIRAIRDFVLPYRKHESAKLRLAAVQFTVGGTKTDIETLSMIALTDERAVAEAAVFAIVSVQGRQAKETLLQLQSNAQAPWLKRAIAQAMDLADSPRIHANQQSGYVHRCIGGKSERTE